HQTIIFVSSEKADKSIRFLVQKGAGNDLKLVLSLVQGVRNAVSKEYGSRLQVSLLGWTYYEGELVAVDVDTLVAAIKNKNPMVKKFGSKIKIPTECFLLLSSALFPTRAALTSAAKKFNCFLAHEWGSHETVV